jgi:hypothetical protein
MEDAMDAAQENLAGGNLAGDVAGGNNTTNNTTMEDATDATRENLACGRDVGGSAVMEDATENPSVGSTTMDAALEENLAEGSTLAGGSTAMEDATDAALEENLAGGSTVMEDATDAPQCWNSESILVFCGEGREPIDIAPYLVDEQDEKTSLRRLEARLEFPADVYPPSWEKRKVIEDAVKNAVSKADNINLNVYATRPHYKFPSTTLACDMARSNRPPKNPDEIQATVNAKKEDLPRLDKANVRQDRMVNKKKANRVNGQRNPKRTYTGKPPPKECCTFRIRLMLDPGKCWFLPPWAGCRFHKFHPKFSISEKRRRMDTCTEKERDDAAIFTRQGSAGVGIGILKEQTGNTFSGS